jgi:hypothetical protein
MNDFSNRPVGGDELGARLERACAEGHRLRVQHREVAVRLRLTVDSLNRFIFTRSDADCAPYSGCSQPASPSA